MKLDKTSLFLTDKFYYISSTLAITEEGKGARALFIATSVPGPDAVMPLLEVWVTLFPESSEEFQARDRAHVVSGELAPAVRGLHTTLELNPESETIPKLLPQLDGG